MAKSNMDNSSERITNYQELVLNQTEVNPPMGPFIVGPTAATHLVCSPDHTTTLLFQVAHICLLLAYLVPSGKYCVLLMHSILMLANVLVICWMWTTCVTLSNSLLGWSITYLVVNIARVLYHLYTNRQVKLSKELTDVYEHMFHSIRVPKDTFKKLVMQGKVMSLHAGEAYAMERLTTTDRLSLLIYGKINVISGSHFLHSINAYEFLDSPEWESGMGAGKRKLSRFPSTNEHEVGDNDRGHTGQEKSQPLLDSENRFNVSLIAATPCRYLCWNRTTLEYYLANDSYTSNVFSLVLARDITNKLYQMNAKIVSNKGSQLDIRLPVIITSLTKQLDERSLNSWSSQRKHNQQQFTPYQKQFSNRDCQSLNDNTDDYAFDSTDEGFSNMNKVHKNCRSKSLQNNTLNSQNSENIQKVYKENLATKLITSPEKTSESIEMG